MFDIGISVKEVESEAYHRAASELSSLLFRYKNNTIEEAMELALKGVATKYLTGVADQSSLFDKLLKDYFHATLEILSILFRFSRKIKNLSDAHFGDFIVNLWTDYSPIVPIAHLLNMMAGQRQQTQFQESIRFLTGNVCDPRFREYLFSKNYPHLKYYYDSYYRFKGLEAENLDIKTEPIIGSLKHGMESIHPEITEFLASVYNFIMAEITIQDVLDDLFLFIFVKLRYWVARPDAVSILSGVFGTTEAVRLELKYSGLTTESDTIEQAIDRLKQLFKMLSDTELFPKQKEEKKEKAASVQSAIEEIANLRKTKINLDSNLQKKRFIQGFSLTERDIFFQGLTGHSFRDYVATNLNNLETEIDVQALDTMGLERLYKRLFKEDPEITMYNAIQEKVTSEQGAPAGSGHESAIKFEKIVKILVQGRSSNQINQAFRNPIRLRAIFNGLSDDELTDISQILFKTTYSSKQEALQEFLAVIAEKDKFTSDGTDLATLDQKKEAIQQLREFGTALIRYALSPAFFCFDLAIDMIYWTKENVNDIFISLDSSDAFQQNLGKIVIHSLTKEARSVFPRMRRNSHLTVAFLSSMITKEKIFSDILIDVSKGSLLIETYSGLSSRPLPLQCRSWSIANEVWFRHLAREIRERKKTQAQKIVQKLSPEEKARRAYQIAEIALAKYTYSIRSRQGISLLTITHEDAFVEFLKFLRQHGAKELLDTEFSIADETLNMGSISLREAVIQIIHEDFYLKFKTILRRIESLTPVSEDEIQDISATSLNLFNESLIIKLKDIVFLERDYLEKIQKFCSRNQVLFVHLKTHAERRSTLEKIIKTMGSEFIKLIEEGEKINQYIYVKDIISSVFEPEVTIWIRKLIEKFNDENIENFGRVLWSKGIKRNSFTVLLNHLLVEYARGLAEIGTEHWRRYGDRCRYILRRIDKTCQIVK
ncbi:MAG: hypothetical protein ACXAC7_06420 [Candidatus Hodarchaeales archaeon]